MTTPKKLARQRRRKQAQQEHLQNLARGAQEAAAKQQHQGTPVNPDDPKGLVAGGSASVRIVSEPGVQPTNSVKAARVATRKRRQSSSVRVVTDKSRRNQTTKIISEQRDPTGRQVSYGNARVIPPEQPPRMMPSQPQQQPYQTAAPQAIQQANPGPQVRQVHATVDVTVILTCFERPNMLRHQLTALKGQSAVPKNIVVWVNAGSVGHDETALSNRELQVVRANVNYGPWARFAMAAEIARQNGTKYTCILDDDTVPGPKWIQACIDRLEMAEANPEEGTYCIASTGDIFRSDDPNDFYGVGPERQGPEEYDVDVGRRGWFFRTELLQAFQSHPRLGDGRIGWGLHFAAVLQKMGIFTLVLPFEYGNPAAWGVTTDPVEENSLGGRLGPELPVLRADLYHAYRETGWMPLFVIDQQPDEVEEKEDVGGVEEGSVAPSAS